MNRYVLAGVAGLALVAGLIHSPFVQAQDPVVRNSVGVCDWATPANCLKPNSDGSLPVGASSSLSTGQANATTVAAEILAANSTRKFFQVTNNGAVAVYVGATGVTSSTGLYLAPSGGSFRSDQTVYTGALFGITATSSAVVSTIQW